MSSSGGTVIKVQKYLNHPENGRKTQFDYDFALLELSEPLQFSEKVQPVALPDEKLEVPDAAMVEISGWGKIQTIFYLNVKRNKEICAKLIKSIVFK